MAVRSTRERIGEHHFQVRLSPDLLRAALRVVLTYPALRADVHLLHLGRVLVPGVTAVEPLPHPMLGDLFGRFRHQPPTGVRFRAGEEYERVRGRATPHREIRGRGAVVPASAQLFDQRLHLARIMKIYVKRAGRRVTLDLVLWHVPARSRAHQLRGRRAAHIGVQFLQL